jgi:hypothetical protein
MSFADIKTGARQDVHDTFAVACEYRETLSSEPVLGLTARLHTRIVVGGENGAYASIIEGVTRAVFDRAQLAAKTLVLRRNGIVTFTDYGLTFVLDIRDPKSGPVTEKWSLAPGQ